MNLLIRTTNKSQGFRGKILHLLGKDRACDSIIIITLASTTCFFLTFSIHIFNVVTPAKRHGMRSSSETLTPNDFERCGGKKPYGLVSTRSDRTTEKIPIPRGVLYIDSGDS